MPLRVVIPSSDINPIIAGMFNSPEVSRSINTPPIIASGMLTSIIRDSLISWNSIYRSIRMIIRAPIDAKARVLVAAASLSN